MNADGKRAISGAALIMIDCAVTENFPGGIFKMLLHIRPRLYSPFRNVELLDMEISPFGIQLVGGVDLVTRRPYPNKHYVVGCRKQGKKAIDGLLIETAKPVDGWLCVTRWTVEGALLATHVVHYRLLDHDFDAASDDMMLWSACSADLGGWSTRRLDGTKGVPPAQAEPVMEIVPPTQQRPATEDTQDQGYIVSRCQLFALPTIERERLMSSKLNDRFPPLSGAFHEGAPSRPAKPRPVLLDDDIPF